MTRPGPLPDYAKREALEKLLLQGVSMSEAARKVGVNRKTAKRWRYGRHDRRADGVMRNYAPVILLKPAKPASPRYLSLDERIRIADLHRDGHSLRSIGRLMGRPASTISREIRRNSSPSGRYRPHQAQQHAMARRPRPRPSRLARDAVLRECVETKLLRRWSPEQIARSLPAMFPGQPARWLCAETIYQAVYRPDLGGLRRSLPGLVLRHRHRQRKRRRHPLARRPGRNHVPTMTSIDQRPASVLDRHEDGHWEGDLVMGSGNASAVVTLVERSSRFTFVGHLPPGRKDSATVCDVVAGFLASLPPHLRRTLTWDQGNEMAQHATIAARVPGLAIYVCDAHAPWQRPTNENTNGLLRDYLPKGTNLAVFDPVAITEIQHQLNERPRRSLDWQSPQQLFATLQNTPVLQR